MPRFTSEAIFLHKHVKSIRSQPERLGQEPEAHELLQEPVEPIQKVCIEASEHFPADSVITEDSEKSITRPDSLLSVLQLVPETEAPDQEPRGVQRLVEEQR